ncbi:protein of unknown function (plasmid) [Cupriavidus taiwanensis]|uniref:HTH-like domain-containing protein n=1 Tax=Cupriavidus taiwanensis TaxID=164546 RepID=A0A375EE45_9BURK|nr:protein of unknown function [Cupriavidus taiwanensis]SOZ72406.1 protein of unknown function [Cupriavidus taiwanensis]SOZ74768.1 protein of unknown function [Cupriavidus taiwanensis]SPA03608.1 protein of unknown function [Cupriavidus taiwanensis]SPA11509.1 protein of unknown function [Cupriavidus taiwanensis]
MLTLIRSIPAEFEGAYGSPRMTEENGARGFPTREARVERLMSKDGIRARHKRRYRVTTDSKHKLPVAPNLLNREFTPARRIRCSTRTSRTSGPTRDGCIWRSCWICSIGKSWTGPSSRA